MWSGDDAHRTWCGRGRVSPIRVPVLLCSGYATDGEAEQAILRRVLLFLHQHGKKELEKYTKFFKGFSCYHKAGVIEDMEENFSRHKEDLLQLVTFDILSIGRRDLGSLENYIGGSKKVQNIYHFWFTDRNTAIASPSNEQCQQWDRSRTSSSCPLTRKIRTRGKPCSDITQHDLGHLAGHCRHFKIPACWSICLSAHRVQLPNVARFCDGRRDGFLLPCGCDRCGKRSCVRWCFCHRFDRVCCVIARKG